MCSSDLVAVLAAESLLILLLAGWMNTPGLRWVARLTFALGAITAWNDYPGWDRALMGSATLAGALGLIGARLEGRASQKSGGLAASYFAALATGLMMSAAGEHFRSGALPWVWPVMAVLIAIVGGVLRTREVVWAAHLPLLWAHLSFYSARIKGREWDLAPALALIAVTFAFGIALWAKRRAENVPERARIASNRILRPYGIVAVIAVIVATIDHTPVEWRLTVFTLESLVFVIAAVLAEETLYVGLAMATLATGAIDYGRIDPVVAPRGVAWVNLLAGIGIGIVSERLFKWRMMSLLFYEKTCRRLRSWMVVIITAVTVYGLAELVGKSVLTVVWAVGGFALLVLGFAGKERSYRFAGLIVLLFSLGRAVVYDLGKLETIYRILTYMGLGVILLVLGFLYTKNREKLAKWL